MSAKIRGPKNNDDDEYKPGAFMANGKRIKI